MKLLKYVTLAALCSSGTLFGAPFIDELNNTDNLNPFGDLILDDNSGAGFVTMTRNVSGDPDQGASWNDGGNPLSLSLVDEQYILNITPISQPGNDSWQANIVFFDGGGFPFGPQPTLISFAESSVNPTSNNIATFATDNGIVGAATYTVLFRVGNEYSFSEISAIPEPGHFALLIGGLSLGLLWHRKRQAK